jgi:hypothetical protein
MSSNTAKGKVMNIFLPDKKNYDENSVLVGFNFDNTTIVISSIVSLSSL